MQLRCPSLVLLLAVPGFEGRRLGVRAEYAEQVGARNKEIAPFAIPAQEATQYFFMCRSRYISNIMAALDHVPQRDTLNSSPTHLIARQSHLWPIVSSRACYDIATRLAYIMPNHKKKKKKTSFQSWGRGDNTRTRCKSRSC